MTTDQLAELKDNEIVRKPLANLMARDCFRNSTKLEDMHAADRIDDEEMKSAHESIGYHRTNLPDMTGREQLLQAGLSWLLLLTPGST